MSTTLQAGAPADMLAALLDDVDDALLAFDGALRVQACNRAATRLLGCLPGQPAGQVLAALGPEAVRWVGDGGSGPQAPSLALALPGGRHARLAWRTVAGGGTLRVQVAAAGLSRSPAAQPGHAVDGLRLLWRAPFPVLLQDARHRLVDVNDAYCAFTGRKREGLLGRDPAGLAPVADREALIAARATPPVPGRPGAEQRLVDATGRERHFRATVLPLGLDDGRPLRLSVLQECTGATPGDDGAQWFDLSPSGMLVFDAAGQVLRANAAFAALAGSVPARLADAPQALQSLLGWVDGALLPGLAPGALPIERQAVLVPAGGGPRQLGARLVAFASGPEQRQVLAVVEDRSAEAERDVAHHEIGALMDAAGIGVATLDSEHGWLQPPARTGGGSSQRDNALQGISREIVEPDSLPEYERLQQALRRGERAEARYAVRHPELGSRWLLTRVEPAALAGGRFATSVVTLDVTDRERAQRRNEQLLRELSTILEGSPAGIASLRGEVLVRCNHHFERLLGVAAGAASGATLESLLGGQTDGRGLAQQIADALDTGRPFEAELPWHAAGQPEVWYSLSVRRSDAAGDPPEAVAVLTDITRLKAQQRDLEALLRERELMFSLSEVGIVYRRGGRIERANQAMAELTGFAAPELGALDESALYESPRECVAFEARIDLALRQQGRFVGERRLRRRDGSLVWVQVAVRPVDAEDGGAGTIASYVDVDERNRAREALQTQAERTRAILDSVLVGIVTVRNGGIEWLNRSARRMFGGELADFIGEPIGTVATPEPGHPLRRTDWLARLDEGRAETFECRLKARDGREFWVVGNAVVTGGAGDDAGQQLTFALLDIERRRQAEIRIAQAQQSLQRVIETAPAAIALFDGDSLDLLQMNQTAARLFGVEGAGGSALHEVLRAAGDDGEVVHRELRRDGADGARVWDARVVALPPPAAGGGTQRLLVASDVTEQRAADERRLQAAIAQREALVREVHHRIKNNLQGVAGLLQQNAARHPEVAPVLSEAVAQVQAIAQVYGLQVGGDGPLAVAGVVASIALSVQRTFGRGVGCEVGDEAVREFVLPEAESIPVALALNELMTNAIKHGSGEVSCRLELTDDAADGVVVTIASLARLPADFDLGRMPSGVTGLGLVRALLPRRAATLTIEQQGDEVVARVVLRAPALRRECRVPSPPSQP